MKRCSNPHSESAFLYGSHKTTCPFCHSPLVENTASHMGAGGPVLPPERVVFHEELQNDRAVEFIQVCLGSVKCHGRIVEIDHQELFNSTKHKLFNCVFLGEPYQFPHQAVEYTIRVENITDGFPTETTDFCMFGNYLGRLQTGDEVCIIAKQRNGRRIVKKIYNETTSSAVKPGLQIPASLIRTMAILIALLITALICGTVWLFKSGTLAAGITAVIAASMPIMIICVGLWMLVRSIFPRRRH